MRLDLTEEQEFFRSTTRRFIESEAPLSQIRGRYSAGEGLDRAWWRRAADLGWTSMLVPEARGGGSLSGRPVTDATIVAEEIGRLTAPGPFLAVNLVAAALGRATGHEEVLAGLVAGSTVAAWALGEPGGVWDPAALATSAELRGEEVLLDGVKSYVEAGSEADHLLVAARTGDGVTQLLVPAQWPGVTISALRSLDLSRSFATVRFDGVRLPASSLVGKAGEAGPEVEHLVDLAAVLQGAETVGGLDRVFEFTLEYMNDRYAFGRPISSYQALKHRVADLLLVLESAKGCVDAAASCLDAGSSDASLEASVAKSYIGDHSLHLVQECMQFHGGISVTWEHDIHLYLRRATVNRAVFGTPEDHRDRVCRLLGF